MKDDWNSSYDLRDFLMANIRISAENANRLAPEAWNRIEKYFNAKHRKNMDAANERHAKEVAELTARIEQLSTPSGSFKEHLRRTLMEDKDFFSMKLTYQGDSLVDIQSKVYGGDQES
jgi:hypothetical protein